MFHYFKSIKECLKLRPQLVIHIWEVKILTTKLFNTVVRNF